ncbi:MAG: ferredoxin [Candidatus Fischerbacteria bacterium RBG_13_37_8]|uniref:Ferredoxin n=1 Tax=Candidatus Fischerbacteria bacterium RBG_13_37_8 TaxID=1817863 RepID=A0A1F5V5V2_9BACT|nr:MAG: ferredoxin [Candidatus Fischerbacteria bacterium RBG_13_37_8]
MRAHYGYKDGSGEYFIVLDTDQCNACKECIIACPAGVFEIIVDDYDEEVAAVVEEHRNKLKYSCAPCKPTSGYNELPCVKACIPVAISHSW